MFVPLIIIVCSWQTVEARMSTTTIQIVRYIVMSSALIWLSLVCASARESDRRSEYFAMHFLYIDEMLKTDQKVWIGILQDWKRIKNASGQKKSCISETNERWLSCPWIANVVRDKVERKKKWWNKNKCMDCAFLDSFKTLVDIVCAWSVFDGLFFCLYCCYSDYVIVRAFVYTMDFQFTVFVCSEHLL